MRDWQVCTTVCADADCDGVLLGHVHRLHGRAGHLDEA